MHIRVWMKSSIFGLYGRSQGFLNMDQKEFVCDSFTFKNRAKIQRENKIQRTITDSLFMRSHIK
ncbi:unnamed protein product [Paramecium pentaurelia]|uniref:Uncharacterized protein n=1 Tax=Paramecium pentaurelia TaxID=43138 RepID=A0A8S1YCH6_9CILI|nr:unnamed protein product [Paramecium pentaurelia]